MLRHPIPVVLVLTGLLVGAGCAHKRVLAPPETAVVPVREVRKTPPAPPPRTSGEAVQVGIRAATVAHEQLGRPYRWGGEDPGRGFDCSGLVQWSFGCVGVDLPRVVRDQKNAGRSITGDQLRPGDLLFFAVQGDRVSHVGIYLGGSRFVHAPRSGEAVREDSLDDPWWRQRWSDSRRVVGG